MPLGVRDHAALASISQNHVEGTAACLRRFLKTKTWLGKNNTYAEDTISKISRELRVGAITNPRHMAQYIAASSVLHCSDGWSFLGRSIAALLAGDPHATLHLAYYAELRAAMSLLASSGVGVFKDKHFYIDGANSARQFNGGGGTHDFVWKALESWSALGGSSPLFASLIKPDGVALEGWLQPIGGSQAAAPHLQDWLLKWGMDLSIVVQDRSARNESSYRPDGVPTSWKINADESAEFVREFWSILEPSPQSRFKNIDQAILRRTLESMFQGTTSKTPRQAPRQFATLIERIVSFQNFSAPVATNWQNYLLRGEAPKDPSLFVYSSTAPRFQGRSHLGVLSRAALLLRLATGSSAALLEAAGVRADEMTFWVEDVALARGIWRANPDLDNLTDLWQDVLPAISEMRRIQENPPHGLATFLDVGGRLGHFFPSLTSHERVAIWGLVPS